MKTKQFFNSIEIKVNDLVRICTGQIGFIFYDNLYEIYSIKYYDEKAEKIVINTLENALEFNVITEILGKC